MRVLCEAFRDYPVMRYVLGRPGTVGADGSYERDLHTLVSFFVGCRVLRGDPIFGIADGDELIAVATVSRLDRASPDSVDELREATWARLGERARDRYTVFGRATAPFEPEEPHVHLSMVGTTRSVRGKGHGRALLDAVHAYSDADPWSLGVSLTTEVAANVDLYRYFGYALVGEASVGDAFTSWGLYRRDTSRPTTGP